MLDQRILCKYQYNNWWYYSGNMMDCSVLIYLVYDDGEEEMINLKDVMLDQRILCMFQYNIW